MDSEFKSNVPNCIRSKTSAKLHNMNNHPIYLIKNRIYHFFDTEFGNSTFKKFDALGNVVTVEDNFDLLLIPQNHPSRSFSDTYYLTENTVLRTHTSAHQNELLKSGETNFLVTGDVYRKDEIDRYHFPVFHQMEGVRIVDENVDPEEDLKIVLVKLVEFLFPGKQYRISKDYFPFTHPSFEIEVSLNDKWIEVLGCGVIHENILKRNTINKRGWAFGLGLERLAMILYEIPDIRKFWTADEKFLSQFKDCGCFDNVKYQTYSNLPSVIKDVSFWIDPAELETVDDKTNWTKSNDFFDVVRDTFNDMIEEINLIDSFTHPKSEKYSQCWRMKLSPNAEISDPGAFNTLCNEKMTKLRSNIIDALRVELR